MAVKFEAFESVCISVRNDDGNFPKLPTDPDGVVERLKTWMQENDIWPNIRGGEIGPTWLKAFYAPDDAEKIVGYLKSIGVEGNC